VNEKKEEKGLRCSCRAPSLLASNRAIEPTANGLKSPLIEQNFHSVYSGMMIFNIAFFINIEIIDSRLLAGA
jgi:hypothetical protein